MPWIVAMEGSVDLEIIPWAIGEGTYKGNPVIIRFRQFTDEFPRRTFPERINIFWMMDEPPACGMPSDSETERLHVFENRLVEAVEFDNHSVLSVVLTCNGQREFVFHTADVVGFLERLTNMPQEKDQYPVEIYRNDDPSWDYDESVIPKRTKD
jgi:Family of unknown function (DUF695)